MNIFNTDLTKLVSQSFLEDEKAKQICEVINTELQSLMANVHFAESAYDVDNATEAVLEHIAWQLNSELFFLGATLEEKRRLVKEAIKLHRYKGTKYAVEHSIQMIVPSAKVEEWFEYDGNPYHFRVLNVERRTLREVLTIISLINIMKSLRSWIDNNFEAIDEMLVDLNLLIDIDILMTTTQDINYLSNFDFFYTTVYNAYETADNETVIFVKSDETRVNRLLQVFLLDNNINQEQFNTDVSNKFDENRFSTIIPLVNCFDFIESNYTTLFNEWLQEDDEDDLKAVYETQLRNKWGTILETFEEDYTPLYYEDLTQQIFTKYLTDNNINQNTINQYIVNALLDNNWIDSHIVNTLLEHYCNKYFNEETPLLYYNGLLYDDYMQDFISLPERVNYGNDYEIELNNLCDEYIQTISVNVSSLQDYCMTNEINYDEFDEKYETHLSSLSQTIDPNTSYTFTYTLYTGKRLVETVSTSSRYYYAFVNSKNNFLTNAPTGSEDLFEKILTQWGKYKIIKKVFTNSVSWSNLKNYDLTIYGKNYIGSVIINVEL